MNAAAPQGVGLRGTAVVARLHQVDGIDERPIYLVAQDTPWEISEDEFVSGVPLHELLGNLTSAQHLYFADYASVPGRTRLTRLVRATECQDSGRVSAAGI